MGVKIIFLLLVNIFILNVLLKDIEFLRDFFLDSNKKIILQYINIQNYKLILSKFYWSKSLKINKQIYSTKLCYDYNINLEEDININTKDRNLTIYNNYSKNLLVKILIRTKKLDINLENAKLRVEFTPNNKLKYISGLTKYSPPNIYEYLEAIETNPQIGQIAIGHNPTIDGGILHSKETTYAKFYYEFLKGDFNGTFDIFIDAKISFDNKNYIPYTFSTKAPVGSSKYLPRCAINKVYNPLYGYFNIERGDSTFSQSEAKRYALYTQIARLPYQISIASYTTNSNNEYKKPLKSNATIEVELIKGDNFENSSEAGFDSTCGVPEQITKGKFFKFNNEDRIKVNVPFENYPQNITLKNAIFRIWILTKKQNNKRVILEHNCTSQEDSLCFEQLYKNHYKSQEDNNTKYCVNDCQIDSKEDSCYNCLKKHFGFPICSRDNFSIRPNGFYINIVDDNESKSSKNILIANNLSNNIAHLSAGYYYKLNINATLFNSLNKSNKYYFFVLGNEGDKKAIAYFKDNISCIDKNNTNLNILILKGTTPNLKLDTNSSIIPVNRYILNNTGKFEVHLEDNEWTKVDQQGYPLRPFPDNVDCIKNSTSTNHGLLNGLRGCTISSNHDNFKDLKVYFHPYKFDIEDINLYSNPNNSNNKYIYLNNISSNISQIQNGSAMAINIKGVIKAKGKNDSLLTNYTNGCNAVSLNTKINYYKDQNYIQNLDYTLYIPPVNSTVNIASNKNSPINFEFNKKYFLSSSLGEADFNLYLNYSKEYNNSINPFITQFKFLNISSPTEIIAVDLNKSFYPKGLKDLNSSRIFYFAKVKSKADFYDDITELSVKTPIEITIFCDKDLEYCKKYNIDVNKYNTNEFDWWRNKDHNAAAGEGVVELKPQDSYSSLVLVTPSLVNSFIEGVNNGIKVSTKDVSNRPFTVEIQPTNNMKTNFSWLLFNKYKNEPPKYIYKVRFIDTPAAWSGEGKTGHSINVNAQGKKTKKVDW